MTKLKSIELNKDIITMYKKDNNYIIIREFHDSNKSVIMYPTIDAGFACNVWDKLLETL